ncbi:MAG TPA: TonB-dependent receptor, partial [Bacteroidales bacterium]|nr:TonB-dependent receptor [Bacteroidales bacterium]
MKYIYFGVIFALLIAFQPALFSQETKKAVAEMTKEELSSLSYQDLMNLSLEDLMIVANKFGLSSDEILEYFLNKDLTSASKRAEKSLNSPLSTTVISKEEIENSGATNIPEALRLVPGIVVREKTNGNYDVQIRGNDNLPPNGMMVYSENTITLVMIDGRPVYNYAFGGTFWEALPVDLPDIERIEVIRGPSSALYGPNAVSGAINIITRQVTGKKLHADGQVQAGTNNATTANGAVSFGVTDKLKVRLSGNYNHFDRFDDKFYAFEYGQSYSGNEMVTLPSLTTPGTLIVNTFDKSFPDPKLGAEKYAGNAFIHYDLSKDIQFDLSAGIQHSDVITSALGNNGIPVTGRTSSTHYADLRMNAYGFFLQTNYMTGDQDIQKHYTGFHIVPKVTSVLLEYEKTLGTLVLRPGISYQENISNDEKWVDAASLGGYLNGPKKVSSLAYYLRADYKAFDKLRLIAAIRADKYNKPDVTSVTYQFISSYDINESNVVRAGYSRANRGSFIADTYANYDWQVVPGYNVMHYRGNEDMKLPVMDNVELGYRTRINKYIMLELEAFHSEMKDFTFFTPDQMTLFFDLSPVLAGENPP